MFVLSACHLSLFCLLSPLSLGERALGIGAGVLLCGMRCSCCARLRPSCSHFCVRSEHDRSESWSHDHGACCTGEHHGRFALHSRGSRTCASPQRVFSPSFECHVFSFVSMQSAAESLRAFKQALTISAVSSEEVRVAVCA